MLTRQHDALVLGEISRRSGARRRGVRVAAARRERRGPSAGACASPPSYDPLRDEGEAFAERLRKAGVALRTSRYEGMFHGFFSMSGQLDKAREALAEAAAALRAALA